MKYLILMFLFLTPNVYAGMLDGVRGNPDRYPSLDLLATFNHQGGEVNVPAYLDKQMSQYNDRGMRGQVRLPLDVDTTLLVGGNWYTGDFAYDQGQVLNSYNGVVKGFGVEAGFRFYLRD